MQNNNVKYKVILLAILFFGIFGWAKSSKAEIISQIRRVTWQGNVGVKINGVEGIPTNTDQVDCTHPPYNVATDGTSDARPAIQACVDGAVNRVAFLPAGTYMVSPDPANGKGIHLTSNERLRGAGPGKSIIKGLTGFFSGGLVGFSTFMPAWSRPDMFFEYSSPVDITSGATKGSTQFVTAMAPWSAGDMLVIDQLDDDTADPPIDGTGADGTSNATQAITPLKDGRHSGGQSVLVVSVTGTGPYTTTIEVPLVRTFDPAKSPQAIKFVYTTKKAGLEDLTLDLNLGSTYAVGILDLSETVNCWVSNVEIKHLDATSFISVYAAYRLTMQKMALHDYVYVSGPGHGYGLSLYAYVSSGLFEDNIFEVPLLNDQAMGSVFAYNYFGNLPQSLTVQSYALWNHAGYSAYNLFEGNYFDHTGSIVGDWYHGNSAFNTIFRNYAMAKKGSTYNSSVIGTFTAIRYYNVIGNVLTFDNGIPVYGKEPVYQTTDPSVLAIYQLDFAQYPYAYNINGNPPYTHGQSDGTSASTMLRHGNWDIVTNGIVWDPNISDHTIPNSLYLTSKPSFFGNLSWPAVGPDINPMTGTIPAKARYEGQSYPYGSGDTTPPAAPTGLAVN